MEFNIFYEVLVIFFGVGDLVLVDFIGVDDLMDFVPIKVLHNDSINRVNDLRT